MDENLHKAWLADRAPSIDWTRTDFVSTHEYMTVDQNEDWFWAMCAAIERYGFPASAFGYDYLYLTLNGFHYWWTIECINRVPTADNEDEEWGWDHIADPDHDHVPENPDEVTRAGYLLDKRDIGPNRQL